MVLYVYTIDHVGKPVLPKRFMLLEFLLNFLQ